VVGPLLSSKYRVPSQRPSALTRRRLAERVVAATRAPLALLSAPAGFGKTTLLTEWLAEASSGGAAVAYLALDRRDSDPVLFWTYLVTAMQSAVPGLGDAALHRLASSSSADDATLAVLLNEIEGLSTSLVLALDDYHVIETPDVHEGVTFLLEHQPPQLQLILATRSTRRCRSRSSVRAVSWSRCARPTCGSPSTRQRCISTTRWGSG
jgi:LuxR family transcriptional regulator, maltose regulon positive regulatory protein